MSNRAQSKAQAAGPGSARGQQPVQRDKPARRQARAFHLEASAHDADALAFPRAEAGPRFSYDFSRVSVTTDLPAPTHTRLLVSQPEDAKEKLMSSFPGSPRLLKGSMVLIDAETSATRRLGRIPVGCTGSDCVESKV